MKKIGQGVVVVCGFIVILIMTWLHNQQLSELTTSFKQEEKSHIDHVKISVEREIADVELEAAIVLKRFAQYVENVDVVDVNVFANKAKHDDALFDELIHLRESVLLDEIIATQYDADYLSRTILSAESSALDNIHIQKHYEWLSQNIVGGEEVGHSKIISSTSDQRNNYLYYSIFIVNQVVDNAPIMATFVIDINQFRSVLLKGYYLQLDEIKYMPGNRIEYLNLSLPSEFNHIYKFNDEIGNRKLWGKWAVGINHERGATQQIAYDTLNVNYKISVLLVIILVMICIAILKFSIKSNKSKHTLNQKLIQQLDQRKSELSESNVRNQAIHSDLVACKLKMHSIINASTDGVIICDSYAVITNINQAIKELFGYLEDDVLGQGVDFLFPEYSPKGSDSDSHSECSDEKNAAKLVVTNGISKDNSFLEVELYVTCVKISDNDFFTIIVRDISDRVNKQNKIRDVQENLRAVIDNIAEGIITSDERGNIMTFNPAAETIFGWKGSEILGKNISSLMSDQDKYYHDDYLNKYIKSRNRKILGIGPREVIGVRKNGEKFHMELATSEMLSDNQRVFIAIFRDVSERKMIEKNMHMSYSKLESVVDSHTDDITRVNKELVRARDEALVAARSKAEFLAMMSHEIRTPINGVLGMLSLVRDTDLNSEQYDYIESAYSSGETLLALLNDVLDLSKIDAGHMTLDFTDFDIYQLVEAAISITSNTLNDSDIEIACVIASAVPRRVSGDRGRLRQVLSNLLSNAVKFTANGGVLVALSLDSITENGFVLSFDVSDTGIGIEENDREMVFEAFTQADNYERRNYGGTGLGLSICKRFVLLMGGDISVTSAPGKGSCFTFTANVERSGLVNLFEKPMLSQVFVLSEHKISNDALMMQFEDWAIPAKRISEEDINSGLNGNQIMDDAMLVIDLDRKKHDDFDCYVRGIIDAAMKLNLKSLFVEVDGFCFNDFIGNSLERSVGSVSRPVLPVELASSIGQLLTGEVGSSDQNNLVRAEIDKGTKSETAAKQQKERVTVLVAEDNLVNQKVITAMLKKLGISADIAKNGSEALLALSNPDHNYRFVLMDCQMPEVDGYAATLQQRRLEKENPNIKRMPIIAMTAHALPGDREKCLDAGMDDYITKPISLEVVKKVVEGWS